MRTAFFGGSFDPPHLGHLAIARAALNTLHLHQVLFAPVALQPLKSQGASASFEDRVAMTQLAIQNHPCFALSLLDAPRLNGSHPNYTIDTLHQLRQTLPQPSDLYLLLGEDAFRTLHHWHCAPEIPFAANLIVASRPSEIEVENSLANPAQIAALLPEGISLHPSEPNQFRLEDSQGNRSTLTLLPNLHYDISATQLRTQLHNQESPDVPRAVLDYIHDHHLYSSP